jgi:hypothetical protein
MKTNTTSFKLTLFVLISFWLTPLLANAGCTLTASITNYTNASCYGVTNGSATVTVSGGTKPYIYSWAPSGGSNATATNLASGSYTTTVTDSIGCIATATVVITEPARLNVTTTIVSLPTCDTCCNGKATGAFAGGGTPPYTFHWCNGNVFYWTKDTTICPGTCYFCVTDASGCTTCDSINMTAPTSANNIANSLSINVYPNPSNGFFNIQSNVMNEMSNIEVYNILGEKVYNAPLQQAQSDNTIDLSSQPAGIYLYRLISEKGNLLSEGKLIKE